MSGQLCLARDDGYWWSGATKLSPWSSGSGDFTLGTTKPDATNTGLNVLGLTTAALTVINGDLTINDAYVTANGNVADRLWVKGHLIFSATTPVTVTNSRIEGRTFTGSAPWDGIVHARSTGTPTTARIHFTNCIITAIQPDVGISTVVGERVGDLYRCDLSLGSDILDLWGPTNNRNVRGCYFHDYSFWDNDAKHASDSVHPYWSHSDAIQISAGDNILIEGNHFEHYAAAGIGGYATLVGTANYSNAAYGGVVIMTPTGTPVTNVVAKNNWVHGGDAQIHLALQSGGTANTGNSFTATGNRHGYNSHPWGPYSGNYLRQFYAWDNGMMPSNTGIVSACTFDTTSDVPTGLRGTALPAVTFSSGANQYQCSYQTTGPDLP